MLEAVTLFVNEADGAPSVGAFVVACANAGFVCVTFGAESILLTDVPNNGNFCSFFKDPKLMVEFEVAKLAGTAGVTDDGSDMTVFLICEPNNNSFDFVSLAVSSVLGVMLVPTAVPAAVTGLICDIEAPNLNPDRAGFVTILSVAGKSFSVDVVDGLTPNENVVVAAGGREEINDFVN